MATHQETPAADASSAAPSKPPVHAPTAEDAPDVSACSATLHVSEECVEAELSGGEGDAAVGAQEPAPADAPGTSEDVEMEEKEAAEQVMRCSECELIESFKKGDALRVCVGCKLAVHDKCYADALPAPEGAEKVEEDKEMESAHWKCDCCRRGVERRAAKCVYCGKGGGEGALKLVDTAGDAAFWSGCGTFEEEKETMRDSVARFGHVLCINWDPRRLAAHVVRESKIKPVEKLTKKEAAAKEAAAAAEAAASEETNAAAEKAEKPEEVEEVVPDVSEVLMRDPLTPGECCFCRSNSGVRIQCRRVNCAQFFHVMCAHKGNGHVELRMGNLLQFHAYCNRHRDCTEDIGDLLAKLITRPIRLLVGRDDMRRFGTVAKHLPEYATAAAVMRDLATLIVGYCNKGLRACKTEPPDYNYKHLQVLQFFLSHVPQLEKVYALPPTPAQNLVNDKKLFRRLEQTFNPSRYLAKYPGPFSQQHTCDVCLDPFHERQHLLYCSGGGESSVPHVQHWRCTKRRSSARERERYLPVPGNAGSNKKRKSISIVQDGVRKDIPLPKGLPGITDDIICGVCRAPVDARGLIASRKEAKELDFEKKESKFVQSGCYINPPSAKGYSGYSHGTASIQAARKPPKPNDGKLNNSLYQALGPPKMDRINVQRTTKWLSCVAQIIRLVGTPGSKTSSGPASVSPTEAATSPSGKQLPGNPEAPISKPDQGSNSTAAPSKPAVLAVSIAVDAGTESAPVLVTETKTADNGVSKAEPEGDQALTSATTPTLRARSPTMPIVTPAIQAQFNEAMRLVRPYDSYALSKLETAHDMLLHRSGPGVAVLRMLTHEYTRFVYIKHTRAVEKARNEKRKRAEHEAQEFREKERKRINLEAERALKKQMLAMRNKQRQHLKATSSK
ncbi:unnamed protein product [Phytophthora fragariaefolia]|uniref:Unnamed protein product n=1 Tax=Phytophthora fragariaefolia TaxID=1490495 RepID=A0A9W6X7E9_9STRA|nr:unnamed protein product [Phytophthora fragariaefolia]